VKLLHLHGEIPTLVAFLVDGWQLSGLKYNSVNGSCMLLGNVGVHFSVHTMCIIRQKLILRANISGLFNETVGSSDSVACTDSKTIGSSDSVAYADNKSVGSSDSVRYADNETVGSSGYVAHTDTKTVGSSDSVKYADNETVGSSGSVAHTDTKTVGSSDSRVC
jgi:hypothetical protein